MIGLVIFLMSVIIALITALFICKSCNDDIKNELDDTKKLYQDALDRLKITNTVLEAERKRNEQKKQIHDFDIDTNLANQSNILSDLARKSRRKN